MGIWKFGFRQLPSQRFGMARLRQSSPARRHWVRIIGALGLALALVACSAVKIVYNQAPDIGYWYLDEYVDFTSAQSLMLKAELSRIQTWHRQTQLPAYVQLLQKLQEQAKSDTTKAQVCTVFNDAKRQMITLANWSEGSVASLAASISPAQFQNMERRFQKGNVQYREDFMDGTPAEVRKRRIKLATKRVESFYGSLDARQTALLEQMVDKSLFDARRIYAERLRRQRDVLQTFREIAAAGTASAPGSSAGTSSVSAKTAVHGLMGRVFASPDPVYRAYAEKLVDDGCAMLVALHNSTSTEQRSKAAETLGGYQQDFNLLAGQPQS